MRLIAMPDSGNSQKVLDLLRLTGRAVEVEEVVPGPPARGQVSDPGALPFGKVPVLVLDGGRTIPESNAILTYLGEGTRFVPADPVARAQMLAWMFWEQYVHEPSVAVRRSLLIYPHRAAAATPERLDALMASGTAALATMAEALAGRDWLVAGCGPTLADVCLAPYTRLAPEGGFALPAPVAAWLDRMAALG